MSRNSRTQPGVDSVTGGATLPPRCRQEVWNNLHQLVDQLPPGEIQTAKRFLEYLTHQQEDDETYTAEQQERDIEAAAEIQQGKGIPHEDILRDFGL